MSYITVEGNTAKEITRKTLETKNGPMSICEFRMAVARRDKGRFDNESPMWLTVKTVGEFADDVSEMLNGGERVVVGGWLTEDQWEKEGQQNRKTVIEADQVGVSVRFAARKANGGAASAPKSNNVPSIPADDEEPF